MNLIKKKKMEMAIRNHLIDDECDRRCKKVNNKRIEMRWKKLQ